MVSFRRQVGDTHIVCALHSKRSPSDAEWDEYLGHVRDARELTRGGISAVNAVVVTDGGAPDAAQRKRLADVVRGWEPLAAVISESLLVRGVVTALAWLGMSVRFFPVNEVSAALSWAAVPESEHEALLAEINVLAKTLDGGVRTAEELIA